MSGCAKTTLLDVSVTCLFFLFCWRLFSTPRLSNWCFDIADPIISLVKLSMHKQGSLMMDTYSMFVGMMKLLKRVC
tara:strand:+ start:133 stop:360 length:228 start_codon:yes stop_codon:yes gene_type:complete